MACPKSFKGRSGCSRVLSRTHLSWKLPNTQKYYWSNRYKFRSRQEWRPLGFEVVVDAKSVLWRQWQTNDREQKKFSGRTQLIFGKSLATRSQTLQGVLAHLIRANVAFARRSKTTWISVHSLYSWASMENWERRRFRRGPATAATLIYVQEVLVE